MKLGYVLDGRMSIRATVSREEEWCGRSCNIVASFGLQSGRMCGARQIVASFGHVSIRAL